MNGSVLSEGTAAATELAELRERVRALEVRLARIEGEPGIAVPDVERETAGRTRAAPSAVNTEMAAATIFTRGAMLCFVLLGALILRVLTQQNILPPGFGTILGFTYAGHLILLSLIPGRLGGGARDNSVFQCSGAVLAFFIALESALRTQTMGRISALLTIAGFGLLAVGMGIYNRKPALAGTGIIGGILALVALDLTQTTMGLQLSLFTLLAATGIANSWRDRWHWLRPLTTLIVMALLPAGFFFCGKEPVIAKGLLAASAAFWSTVMLQHLIFFRRLGTAAAWLPIMTVWLAGIQYVGQWPLMGASTGVIAAFALGCAITFTRQVTDPPSGVAGMMATAALAGAIGWAMVDQTGLLCAVGGTALWAVGRRGSPDWAAVFGTLLMLTSAVVGVSQLVRPSVSAFYLLAAGVSATLLISQYVRNGRKGLKPYSGTAMRLAPVTLGAALILLLGLFWDLLNRMFSQPAQLILSQTVVVVLTALVLTFWGHVTHRRSPLFCGLACMVLAFAKLLVIDLMNLRSFYVLSSLILVGLASVAVSVILRRRS